MASGDMTRRRAAGAILGLAALSACERKITPVTADEMSKGDPKAPVTLVEYASVTCAHCADFNARLMPRIEADYIRTGKVRYVYREFLTPPNEVSAQGVLLARCAGKDKYFGVIDAIMASQGEMFRDGDNHALPVLTSIARQVRLTDQQFKACITNTDAIAALQAKVG
ncbi:MAG: thioredoxin domain-containing protein, partial [Asticcacaulis sp.]|nr:thioredoxin domain-containing protein [Asticcacaulis sp.]